MRSLSSHNACAIAVATKNCLVVGLSRMCEISPRFGACTRREIRACAAGIPPEESVLQRPTLDHTGLQRLFPISKSQMLSRALATEAGHEQSCRGSCSVGENGGEASLRSYAAELLSFRVSRVLECIYVSSCAHFRYATASRER